MTPKGKPSRAGQALPPESRRAPDFSIDLPSSPPPPVTASSTPKQSRQPDAKVAEKPVPRGWIPVEPTPARPVQPEPLGRLAPPAEPAAEPAPELPPIAEPSARSEPAAEPELSAPVAPAGTARTSVRSSLRSTARASVREPGHPDRERSARLTALAREEIESNRDGRITFARFMEMALYEPELGYYRQPADRPTNSGDFLTAPETHPIFGWTVARRIEEIWTELDRPDPFWLIEHGAGSGTLALSILEGIGRHAAGGREGAADLLQALRYRPIESNPHRVADLVRRFDESGEKDRLTLPPPTSSPDGFLRPADSQEEVPVSGVLLANEFLDALPVHRVTILGGWLLELFVTWQEGFVEVPAQPSTPELARRLAAEHIAPEQLAEGQVAEICLGLDPWLEEAAGTLARGRVLAIDYGAESTELYDPRRHVAGTLLGYRDHRVVGDPFEGIGLTDLTAHVDFTALRLIGERRGFRPSPLVTQSDFLVAAGLEAELQALQATPDVDPADYMRARSGIVRMLDPRHMGRFRVLELEK